MVGQLGDGTSINKNVPTQIGKDSNWSMVSAGGNKTIAIKKDGTLWAWGAAIIGDGTMEAKNVPTKIGTDSNWRSVNCGNGHILAIKTDGTLWAWGANSNGQLGNGNNSKFVFLPTQVGTENNWSKVALGFDFTLALKTDGTLWAWGWNSYGQLGDGTIINKKIPTQIGTDSNWNNISAGSYHNIGVKTDGIIWTWGGNNEGQLGDATLISKNIPITINCPK